MATVAEIPKTEAELTPIDASEIVDKIRKGKPVRYDHVKVLGELLLSNYQITSLIFISNSKFDADVSFKKCRFSGVVFFDGTTFGGCTSFDDETEFIGMASFSGAKFSEDAHFNGTMFNENTLFSKAKFVGDTYFSGAEFRKHVAFDKAWFSREAHFNEVMFIGPANFGKAKFIGYINFSRSTFSDLTSFSEATFSKFIPLNKIKLNESPFNKATFGMGTFFEGAKFYGDIVLSETTFRGVISFLRATFYGNALFIGTKFEGEILTFKDATFTFANSQERACRIAKNVLAKAGDREKEEYHFYREMEAKRIQKGIRGNSGLGLVDCLRTEAWPIRRSLPRSSWRFLWYDGIEWLFIQGAFGYGVHPKRLMVSWGAIVLAFGLIYWYGKGIIGATGFTAGLVDCIKVSFATAIAPGYIAAIINPGAAGYKTASDLYTYVTMAETIVGTFLWAGFIATFAKKYMR